MTTGGGVQWWRWRCALCAASGGATSQKAAESQFWWHYHTRHSKRHEHRPGPRGRRGRAPDLPKNHDLEDR